MQTSYDRLTNIVGSTPKEVQFFYNWINSVKEPNDDLLNHLVEINGNLAKKLKDEGCLNHEQRTYKKFKRN